MSAHYIAINRGVAGMKQSDFTFGTSSSASSDIELRINDTDANGKTMTKKDVVLACKALERAIESILYTQFPPL